MCFHCRHPDTSEVIAKVRRDFDLDSIFSGDMKECLKAVSQAIRETKVERSDAMRRGEKTSLVDAKLRALRFGAMVLTISREMERNGQVPWLNGFPDRKNSLFM
jgi:hypothetical protein